MRPGKAAARSTWSCANGVIAVPLATGFGNDATCPQFDLSLWPTVPAAKRVPLLDLVDLSGVPGGPWGARGDSVKGRVAPAADPTGGSESIPGGRGGQGVIRPQGGGAMAVR